LIGLICLGNVSLRYELDFSALVEGAGVGAEHGHRKKPVTGARTVPPTPAGEVSVDQQATGPRITARERRQRRKSGEPTHGGSPKIETPEPESAPVASGHDKYQNENPEETRATDDAGKVDAPHVPKLTKKKPTNKKKAKKYLLANGSMYCSQ